MLGQYSKQGISLVGCKDDSVPKSSKESLERGDNVVQIFK